MASILCHGQIDNKFSSKEEYFRHVKEKYSLNISEIYYIPNTMKKSVIVFPSFAYFTKNELLISIDEISNEIDTKCAPKKLFKQLPYKLVDSLLTKKGRNSNLVFKNLKSGKILQRSNELIAVFLFSVNLKKLGDRYIKHKKILEESGIRTLVLSMDMPYIKGVNDYSKINQIRFKNN